MATARCALRDCGSQTCTARCYIGNTKPDVHREMATARCARRDGDSQTCTVRSMHREMATARCALRDYGHARLTTVANATVTREIMPSDARRRDKL